MIRKTVHTPLGSLTLTEDNGYLAQISWEAGDYTDQSPVLDQAEKEIYAYLNDGLTQFQTPLAFKVGTPFQQKVWHAIARIPYGKTVTYGELAKEVGTHPRALGMACGANPIPIIVPCHRVVGGNGKLTGFSGGDGVLTKKAMLDFEKQQAPFTHWQSLRAQLPQKPFYFTRHGQTDYNVKGVLQGQGIDSSLNACGRSHAENAGKALQNIFNPDVVWHSHLQRTKQTAQGVLSMLPDKKRTIRSHKGLGARGFGVYEGKKRPSVKDMWQSNPEGETWLAMTIRLAEALTDVLSKSASTPLIVSHGELGACLGEFLGCWSRDMDMNNCQIWYVVPGKDPLAPWQAEKVYEGEK